MQRNGYIIVGIAAIAALYLYSEHAAAIAPSGDGLPSNDTGDGGTLWDWFPSFGDSNAQSVEAQEYSAVSAFGFDLLSPLIIDTPSPDVDSEANPGIDFGILSNIGAAMGTWKTGEYAKYASAISEAERRHGIPTDGLARLLFQESRYRADVIAGYKRSPVGALGIAQFMPRTAAEFGLTVIPSTYNGEQTQTYDPYASIDAAGRYLKQLFGMFNDWGNALIAYNWGPGNVRKWLRGEKWVKDGREGYYTPPPESRKYLAEITADVRFA